MFKRELKQNFKSFLLWTGSLIFLCFLVLLLYKSIINGSNLENINDVLKSFPPDVLKMFNLDISGIDSAYGWLKTEGIVFIFIVSGMYSAILGSTIVLKEEDEKTIEYLYSLPVSRNFIFFKKYFVGIIYISGMLIMLTMFNFFGLILNDNFDIGQFFALSLSPALPSLVIYSLSMFLSTFFHKTKKIMPLCMGITFVSYFLYAVSQMNEKVEFFKYFSVFSLSDSRNIIQNNSFSLYVIVIFVLLFGGFSYLSLYHYNKKELL